MPKVYQPDGQAEQISGQTTDRTNDHGEELHFLGRARLQAYRKVGEINPVLAAAGFRLCSSDKPWSRYLRGGT